jgi:hypothetical protein
MLGEDWRETYINFIRDQRLPAGMSTKSQRQLVSCVEAKVLS